MVGALVLIGLFIFLIVIYSAVNRQRLYKDQRIMIFYLSIVECIRIDYPMLMSTYSNNCSLWSLDRQFSIVCHIYTGLLSFFDLILRVLPLLSQICRHPSIEAKMEKVNNSMLQLQNIESGVCTRSCLDDCFLCHCLH